MLRVALAVAQPRRPRQPAEQLPHAPLLGARAGVGPAAHVLARGVEAAAPLDGGLLRSGGVGVGATAIAAAADADAEHAPRPAGKPRAPARPRVVGEEQPADGGEQQRVVVAGGEALRAVGQVRVARDRGAEAVEVEGR